MVNVLPWPWMLRTSISPFSTSITSFLVKYRPKPVPPAFTCRWDFTRSKRLEQLRQVRLGNPNAGIAHRQFDRLFQRTDLHADLAGFRVLHRVAEQMIRHCKSRRRSVSTSTLQRASSLPSPCPYPRPGVRIIVHRLPHQIVQRKGL